MSRSRVKCKFLQVGLDVILDNEGKLRFIDLNHFEGSLRLVSEHILQKSIGIRYRISHLALLGVLESDCAFRDLAGLDFYV